MIRTPVDELIPPTIIRTSKAAKIKQPDSTRSPELQILR
jgi:hypothetical protein